MTEWLFGAQEGVFPGKKVLKEDLLHEGMADNIS